MRTATDTLVVDPTMDEFEYLVDSRMRLCNEKQNAAMCAVVEDTFGEILKMAATDFEDGDVKMEFYKIFRNVVNKAVDGRRIRPIITHIASNAVDTAKISTESQRNWSLSFMIISRSCPSWWSFCDVKPTCRL